MSFIVETDYLSTTGKHRKGTNSEHAVRDCKHWLKMISALTSRDLALYTVAYTQAYTFWSRAIANDQLSGRTVY